MNTKDEALKMAIETLEAFEITGYCDETIQACKEALAQPAQEPVAIIEWSGEANCLIGELNENSYDLPEGTKLYTHPAPSWVGLSDDEIEEIWHPIYLGGGSRIDFARAIEQALKAKNHG